jgi:hypothetical protein
MKITRWNGAFTKKNCEQCQLLLPRLLRLVFNCDDKQSKVQYTKMIMISFKIYQTADNI